MTPLSTPDTLRDNLLRLPLFSGLNEAEIAQLMPGVREYKVRAHEMLFQKGDLLRGIHLLVSGQAKLFLPTSQGAERVIAMVNPGSSFGEAVVFLDKPVPVSAQAMHDSVVLIVHNEVLLGVLDRNPQFARKLLASISMRLHELLSDIETCTLMNSVQRVVCFLSQQAPQADEAEYEVRLDTSKQTLASRLNLAAETFSRALHHLATAGLIEVQGRTIRVKDVRRLRAFQG